MSNTMASIEPPSIATIQVRHSAGVRVRRMTRSVMRAHQCWHGSLSSFFSRNDAATGNTVIAMMNDAETATAIVRARSWNSCPSIPVMNSTGAKIATLVTVDANSAPEICRVPLATASFSSRPLCRQRTMFSSVTIAASMTRPTANARPAREMTFSDLSNSRSATNATSSDSGTVAVTRNVARRLRMRKYSTPTASSRPIPRLLRTREIARRMCTDASKLRSISSPASARGPAFSSTIARLTSSRILTVFASNERCNVM